MTVLPVADFARHMNMTPPTSGSDTETKLSRYLGAAEKYVTDRCGPLQQTSIEYKLRPSGRYLVTPDIRLTAVTAVTDPDGATVTPRDINLAAGVLELTAAPTKPGDWIVTATVGAATVNDDLALATLFVAAQLWDSSQRGQGGRPSADGTVPRGFAAPARALELMADYMLPGIG